MKKNSFIRSITALVLALTIVLSGTTIAKADKTFNDYEIVLYAKCMLMEPIAGVAPDFIPIPAEPAKYNAVLEGWYYYDIGGNKVKMTENDVFAKGETYEAYIRFIPTENYTFYNTIFSINGREFDYTHGSDLAGEGTGFEWGLMNYVVAVFDEVADPLPDYVPGPKEEVPEDMSSFPITRSLMIVNTEALYWTNVPGEWVDLGPVPYGTVLEYDDMEDGYYHVSYPYARYDGEYWDAAMGSAFVKKSDVCLLPHPDRKDVKAQQYYQISQWRTVRTDLVTVQFSPEAASYYREETLSRGERVLELQRANGFSLIWYTVPMQDKYGVTTFGWVPTTFLYNGSPQEYETQMVEESYQNPNRTTYRTLRDTTVYETPSDSGKSVGTLKENRMFTTFKDSVYYDEYGDPYVRMNYEDKYVPLKDLQVLTIEYYETGRLAVITTDSTNIYTKPKTGRGVPTIGHLDAGAVVTYWGVHYGFLIVLFEGQIGYIYEPCTHRCNEYDVDQEYVFTEEFRDMMCASFYNSTDRVEGAEYGTPVYIHPEEDPHYLLGYINTGIYAIQGEESVDGGFYKIEYNGEAGFVPKRFKKEDVMYVSELTPPQWAGAPLDYTIMDRYYVTTEPATIYSKSDPSKSIGLVKAGTFITGQADSNGGTKMILNPVDQSEPYALIETSTITPYKPSILDSFDSLKPAIPETLYFNSKKQFTVYASGYYPHPKVSEIRWVLKDRFGQNVTDAYLTHRYTLQPEAAFAIITPPDDRLDGGILTMEIVCTDGSVRYKQFYLHEVSQEMSAVDSISLTPDANGLQVDGGDRFTVQQLVAGGQVTLGSTGITGKVYDYVFVPSIGYTFSGFTADLVDTEQLSSVGLAVQTVVEELTDGSIHSTFITAQKPKNVTVTAQPAGQSKDVFDGVGTYDVQVTFSASASNAKRASWYVIHKNSDGSVTKERIEAGKDIEFALESVLPDAKAKIAGSSITTGFDPASGNASLAFTIKGSDFPGVPTENVFCCFFEGDGGAKALTDVIHIPSTRGDQPKVTEEEASWTGSVMAPAGLTTAPAATVDISDPEKLGVHVHSYHVTLIEGDCEEGYTVTARCDCGEKITYDRTGAHNFSEWSVKKFATLEEAGEEHRICLICGKEETRETEKLVDADGDGFDDATGIPAGVFDPGDGDGTESHDEAEPSENESTEAPESTEPEETKEEEAQPSLIGNVLKVLVPVLIGVAAAAGIAVAIVLIVNARKKKKAASESKEEEKTE